MPDRDELDRLIDSELARYAEPRAGLEQRILARVGSEAMRRPGMLGRWRAWVLAGAVATAIVLVVGIPRFTHRQTSVNTARATDPDHGPIARAKNAVPEVHVQLQHLPPTVKTKQGASRVPAKTVMAERPHLPKLDVFPAPQPLSPQEQALVAIATARSDSGRESLLASQRQLNAPLQISAIEIPAITMPDEGNK